jgi:outer membrane protein OmpA-like peptidoglycan-associated protein
MKKITFTLLAILSIGIATRAQRYYGIANSNYSAINGLYINPANISDNRMLMDLQFASFNGAVNQNYGYISSFKNLTNAINNGTDVTFTRSSKTTNIGFAALGEVRGPSFMMQIGKKQAIGLLTRGRAVGSGSGINTDYFTFINDGIRGVKLGNGTTFGAGSISATTNAFTEIGLVYGREILNEGRNFIKGGIVLKRYNGILYSSARFNDFTVKLIDTSTSKVQFNGSIKASSNTKDFSLDNIDMNKALFGGDGNGIGVDIGAVYEFRDEDPISTARYENKYKFKIGFAIQDIGSMKYKASSTNENYELSTIPTGAIIDRVDTANIDFGNFTEYFRNKPGFNSPPKNNNATKVKAPTVVTVYGDYKFSKHVYVNALFTSGLVGNKTAGNRTPFQSVVTPRFEGTFLDAGLPISYNSLSKDVKVGLGLRLGIFYIGSDDFISSATGLSKFTSANVYAGLHAAIPYRKPKSKRDRDEDETPEPVKEVKAPKVEAPKDTDGDGIFDNEDKCPTVAGVKVFNGCPDTDADGIQDSEDKCPTIAGIKEFDGCADTDGDGVQDSEDDCPTVKGLVALKGCTDTDGDGVADKDDKCVDRPGPVDNDGCPRVSEVVKKQLDFAAKAIQFEVGKDILRPISFAQLDEVVKILNEYQDYQIIIDGHTDNTGKADKNQILSDKRAAAVKNYFIKKGIDASRMISTGYGDTKPLVENNSVPNKAKNRRVELNMKLKD